MIRRRGAKQQLKTQLISEVQNENFFKKNLHLNKNMMKKTGSCEFQTRLQRKSVNHRIIEKKWSLTVFLHVSGNPIELVRQLDDRVLTKSTTDPQSLQRFDDNQQLENEKYH